MLRLCYFSSLEGGRCAVVRVMQGCEWGSKSREVGAPSSGCFSPGAELLSFKRIVKANPGTCILLFLLLICDNGRIAFVFCASVLWAAGAGSVSLCVCKERWSSDPRYSLKKKKKVINHQCNEFGLSTVLWIPTLSAACAGVKDLGASCTGRALPAAFLSAAKPWG